MIKKEQTKHIVIVAPPMASILDIAGPLEVFSKAIDYIRDYIPTVKESYTTHVLSVDSSNTVTTSSGLPIVCEGGIESINYEVDTFLVAGNVQGAPEKTIPPLLLNWLKDNVSKTRRVGSICAGAFVLAEAGILNGHRATSHWRVCDKMAKLYPEIKVEKDPIYVKDGNLYTSAGISAGMDLSLAMVEEDFGRNIALEVARILVLFLKRPGNQSQYSKTLEYQHCDYEPINKIREWIFEHIREDLTVEVLAEKSLMSPRNFARVFLREMNITPAKYIEKIRLETACRYLVEKQLTQSQVAVQCGLKTSENMKRLFIKTYETTPGEYKRKFRSSLA